MFKFLTKYTLSQEGNNVYHDIAYDGCSTYLCTSDRQVIVLDQAYAFVKTIPTYYSYHTLCYDNTRRCFWAASLENPGILFKLSDSLEIDAEIEMFLQGESSADIDGLLYDSATKHLLAAKGNVIYAVGPAGELQHFFKIKELEETPRKICVLPDRFICLSLCQEDLHLKQFSRSDGKIVMDEVLSDIFRAASITLTHNNLSHSDFSLLLLAEETNYSSYIVELKPEPSDVQMQQLGRFCLHCPFWIGSPNNCNTNRSHACCQNCCSNNRNFCNNSCNLISPVADCCENDCSDSYNPDTCNSGCCNPGCCYPSSCHHQACTQVIESIALTETSIAHILNAEGEKLQKAIACSCNVNDLLKINASVLKTIVHSTQLEQVLFYKLEAALRGEVCDSDCGLCPPPCRGQTADQTVTGCDPDSENYFSKTVTEII